MYNYIMICNTHLFLRDEKFYYKFCHVYENENNIENSIENNIQIISSLS